MIPGGIFMLNIRKIEAAAYKSTNDRHYSLRVDIPEWKKTGLNKAQIGSMLVSLMGNCRSPEENIHGLPYHPSIEIIDECGTTLVIVISVNGRREIILELIEEFKDMMGSVIVHHKKCD